MLTSHLLMSMSISSKNIITTDFNTSWNRQTSLKHKIFQNIHPSRYNLNHRYIDIAQLHSIGQRNQVLNLPNILAVELKCLSLMEFTVLFPSISCWMVRIVCKLAEMCYNSWRILFTQFCGLQLLFIYVVCMSKKYPKNFQISLAFKRF